MYTAKWSDMQKQMRAAQVIIERMEQDLRDAGYVNTVYDCWEKVEEANNAKS